MATPADTQRDLYVRLGTPRRRRGLPAGALVLALAALATGCGAGTRSSEGRPQAVGATAPAPAVAPTLTRASVRPRAAVVLHGSRRRRWVALTFDADMTEGMRAELHDGRHASWVDAALFAELRRTRTPATIFLTGLWAATYPREVRRLARDPRVELENHSYDHAAWRSPCYGLPTVSTPHAKRIELERAQGIIRRESGQRPRYFRFPGVCHSATDLQRVARLGLQPVDGDVVSGDAFNPDTRAIVEAVLRGVRPGSIVIAHCIGAPNAPGTAAAMSEIIPQLRRRGYRFVTLRRLLAARPSPHQITAGP